MNGLKITVRLTISSRLQQPAFTVFQRLRLTAQASVILRQSNSNYFVTERKCPYTHLQLQACCLQMSLSNSGAKAMMVFLISRFTGMHNTSTQPNGVCKQTPASIFLQQVLVPIFG